MTRPKHNAALIAALCFCVFAVAPVFAQINEAQALDAIKLATNPTSKLAAAEDFIAKFPKSTERLRIAELIADEILKIKDGAVAVTLLDRAKAIFTADAEREVLKTVALEAYASPDLQTSVNRIVRTLVKSTRPPPLPHAMGTTQAMVHVPRPPSNPPAAATPPAVPVGTPPPGSVSGMKIVKLT